MSKISVRDIPTLRSAEELLDWLISEFEAIHERNGYIVITADDVATLIIELERFRQNSARTDGQQATDKI